MPKIQDALILCGGKSSRMGFDKTLLKYDSYTSITHYLFEKLSFLFTNVQISAKEQKFTPALALLKDDFDDYAPIFVIANLDKFFNSSVFIIPADQPFIQKDTIISLYKASKNADIVVASSLGQTHQLCGFFNPKISSLARRQIKNQKYAIRELINSCNTKILNFDDARQFINLNTTKDIDLANKALKTALKY